MTDKIPESVLKEAEAIAKDVPSRVTKDHRPFIASVIARALLARDQRAAEIARDFFDLRHDALARAHGANIAKHILSYDEAQQ